MAEKSWITASKLSKRIASSIGRSRIHEFFNRYGHMLHSFKSVGNLSSRFVQYSGRLHLSVITLGELYTWAMRKNAPPKHLEALMIFLSDAKLLDVNHEIAQTFGTIRAQLFDKGLAVSGMDIMIAATALVHDLTLVTHNVRHFERIPGLRVVDWLET